MSGHIKTDTEGVQVSTTHSVDLSVIRCLSRSTCISEPRIHPSQARSPEGYLLSRLSNTDVLDPSTAAIVVAFSLVIFLAGAINGLAGFGFALVGTMALATNMEPSVAVAVMIVPMLAVNLSLVRQLSRSDIEQCVTRFWPLMISALAGTLLGMALIGILAADPLRIVLGFVSLAFVTNAQRLVTIPALDRAREGCFVETLPGMVGVGSVSGLMFGGTNVGVQLVAYVRSCDLSHGMFIGVVAMLFVGINGLRVGAAGVLGLYPDIMVLGGSMAASIPAVLGVAAGTRLRSRVTVNWRRGIVLGLLTIIGIRLILGGWGIV